jgi:phenylpropionate dioxygenase-like ring-hydroxylating dioxygenase large terminal subunit
MKEAKAEPKRWTRIALSRDIPLREGRAVKVGDREIAIFNLGDRFLAVDNRCPHKGGPLADGIVSGAAVVCPLHAWKSARNRRRREQREPVQLRRDFFHARGARSRFP